AIFVFYAWLTVLEDIGYLPRLAMLVDSLLGKIGLPGYAIVPTILGMGCNVPGMAASRILDTKKQRFTLSTILAIAVPCNAQISVALVIIGGMYGYFYLIPVVLILIFLYAGIGALLNRLIPSENPPTIMDIPPYRMPLLRNVASKLAVRMRYFFFDAVPWVIIGILVIDLLYLSGALEALEDAIGPLLVIWLGIPAEMVGALIIGFLRKDVAIAFLYLIPDMTVWQAITGIVILMIYFPCAATFAMMLKEQGVLNTLKSTGLMLIIALMTGGMLHAVGLLW
ncbi:MAG: nucleoside recognition domain-containing protein, partial [Euryarchaeota archaeon]|nr:nucleoside recognition domain-containing protein [Euryarchaeota archaeon]